MPKKINSKKPFKPPQPIQSIPPEMGQQPQQMSLPSVLLNVNLQFDAIKKLYNDMILGQYNTMEALINKGYVTQEQIKEVSLELMRGANNV